MYDTIIVDSGHHACPYPQNILIKNAHCRLLIMMCQCRFTESNKYTALLQDLDSGGGCMYWGADGIWKLYVLSSQFCCEPKTALKNFNKYIFFNQTEFSVQFSQTCKSGYDFHLSAETLLPFIATRQGSWPSPIHRNWLEARKEIQARFYGGLCSRRGQWKQTTGSLACSLPKVGQACSL